MRGVFWKAAVCGAVLALAGCGKKGPPLTPFVRLPGPVPKVEARRVGDDVYVTVTVPVQNVDASTPADVRRVEVYAYTATAPRPRARSLEMATLVATVPVAPGPSEGALAGQRPLTPAVAGAAAQGGTVTVKEPLTAGDLIASALPAPVASGRAAVTPRPEAPGALRRFYVAIPFSDRGRPGPQGPVAELPLTALPDAPAALDLGYTADVVTLSWAPAGGIVGFLLDRPLALDVLPVDEGGRAARPLPPPASLPPGAAPATAAAAAAAVQTPAATPPGPVPPGPTRYNVYRELAPDPLELPVPAGATPPGTAAPPVPLNPAPLEELSFTETVEFDRARCYVVRAVRGGAGAAVEGAGSPRRCVVPVDVFAPSAPIGLSSVAAAGAISLIWEPNVEVDLGGYLVLRGSTSDATLLPLMTVPVQATQFTDTTVTPGQRYVYAVVAVDSRVPLPNVSAESPRIEETAR